MSLALAVVDPLRHAFVEWCDARAMAAGIGGEWAHDRDDLVRARNAPTPRTHACKHAGT